jgi:hypothetical protein
MARFWDLLNDGTIEAQKPDGREIVSSMRRAVMNGDRVEWHETCYCSPPLRHERTTVYDQYFADMEIGPLVSTAPPEAKASGTISKTGTQRKARVSKMVPSA